MAFAGLTRMTVLAGRHARIRVRCSKSTVRNLAGLVGPPTSSSYSLDGQFVSSERMTKQVRRQSDGQLWQSADILLILHCRRLTGPAPLTVKQSENSAMLGTDAWQERSSKAHPASEQGTRLDTIKYDRLL